MYPFLGLVFLFGGRVHSFYNPFNTVVGGCTKYGQPQQHAHHFISGQRPYQGLSGEIFEQHLSSSMSVHWLGKDVGNKRIRQKLDENSAVMVNNVYSYRDHQSQKLPQSLQFIGSWCKPSNPPSPNPQLREIESNTAWFNRSNNSVLHCGYHSLFYLLHFSCVNNVLPTETAPGWPKLQREWPWVMWNKSKNWDFNNKTHYSVDKVFQRYSEV